MTWLTVTEYKWPRICFLCRNHNTTLSPFIPLLLSQSQYHSFPIHTTPFVAITLPLFPYSYHSFCGVHTAQSVVFCVVFCISLFFFLSLFFWPLYYLSFCDIRLWITPLVSSNLFTIQTLQHRRQLDDYWVQEVDNINLTTP
jgi:hypothetical protein